MSYQFSVIPFSLKLRLKIFYLANLIEETCFVRCCQFTFISIKSQWTGSSGQHLQVLFFRCPNVHCFRWLDQLSQQRPECNQATTRKQDRTIRKILCKSFVWTWSIIDGAIELTFALLLTSVNFFSLLSRAFIVLIISSSGVVDLSHWKKYVLIFLLFSAVSNAFQHSTLKRATHLCFRRSYIDVKEKKKKVITF